MWKTDENLIAKPSAIYIRELEKSGKSFKVNSIPKKILQSDKPEVSFRNILYKSYFNGHC